MDRELDDLTLAVVATRHGPGPATSSRLLRKNGPDAARVMSDNLPEEVQAAARDEASDLFQRGIRAVLLGSTSYPTRLKSIDTPPAALFFRGRLELLEADGVGLCGSRNASEVGLKAAKSCGEVAADMGFTVVSGYAKGVDTTSHIASLQRGGTTVIVLPEGINGFRVKKGEFSERWDEDRAVVVSQFSPSQPWRASAAMARNSVIIGLSAALVVVEAGEKGGTLAAGQKAIELGKRVLALEFDNLPRGNRLLIDRGAIAVRSRLEIAEMLDQLRELDEDEREQYSLL